jgi:hypothetical protein
MALQVARTIPTLMLDDGAAFIFAVLIVNVTWMCGFMHRPSHTVLPKSGDPVVQPPVAWSDYDNLNSWVETLKYAYRNRVYIYVYFDPAITLNYQTWSGAPGLSEWEGAWEFHQVYSVTG